MKDPNTRRLHGNYIRNTDKNKWCWDYKISIVIPTRGRIDLLEKCLVSILDKSFKSERLFEIILVIDYDDDETLTLGWTPPNLKAEITTDVDGYLRRRELDASGVVTYPLV